MRLALLSDVHGNPIALDAVLGDIDARGGADGYWVLGDLVGIDNLSADVRSLPEAMRYSSYEHSHCFLLQRLPLPATDHLTRRMAVPSLPT